jgi:pyroglutamyl-peptidase
VPDAGDYRRQPAQEGAGGVLVTGFEGYGGRGFNPTAEIAATLDGERIAGQAVAGAVLPVAYATLADALGRLLREHRPRAVICLGLWPGEAVIRLERFGLNLNHFEIPDNAGALMRGALDEDGPVARAATLPLERILDRLLAAGIPAKLSSTAGNFLCNATLYTVLGLIEREAPGTRCGFIHVPYDPRQVAEVLGRARDGARLELHQRSDFASMALETSRRAVRIAIETTLGEAA